MRSLGLAFNQLTYTTLVTACAEQRQVAEAQAYVEEMRAAGLKPSVLVHCALMTVCTRSGRWQESLQVRRLPVPRHRSSPASVSDAFWGAKTRLYPGPKSASTTRKTVVEKLWRGGCDMRKRRVGLPFTLYLLGREAIRDSRISGNSDIQIPPLCSSEGGEYGTVADCALFTCLHNTTEDFGYTLVLLHA